MRDFAWLVKERGRLLIFANGYGIFFFLVCVVKCLAHTEDLLYLNVMATILDIITDMMSKYNSLPLFLSISVDSNRRKQPKQKGETKLLILLTHSFTVISIPILVLQKSQMKPKQKLGLGIFLCLSLVMILITIIRASNLPNRNPLSTWQYMWLYLEACIATIMASITAFRTLFVQRNSADKKQKAAAAAAAVSPPSGSYYSSVREKLLRKMGRWKRLGGGWEEMSSGERAGSDEGSAKGGKDLPQVPSATMTGIRTFIYRNGRTVDEDSVVRSGLYTFDEEDQTFHATKP